MDEIRLEEPTRADAERIAEYRAEFPEDRMQVTCDPDRIPGLDGLEDFDCVADWLRFCETMRGKITWYMAVRNSDGRIVGFCCLRRKLEYDDDDPQFASHIGYSIRPGERGKGYAVRQLRLVLQKAREMGISTARIVCSDVNTPSSRTILSCGGIYVDSVYGQESGITVNRYDVPTG